MYEISSFSFSVNTWEHLYSLQKAIQYQQQSSGRTLSIQGRILNHALLQNQDTPVQILFQQSEQPPHYPRLKVSSEQEDIFQLGEITHKDRQLSTTITVEPRIFEELRKNLMEYGDIDGIHIVLTLGVLRSTESSAAWPEGETLPLVQLDYAMKGDSL